jgi:hypothetical protein
VFDQALQQFDKVVCVFSAKHLQHILILVIDLLSDLHHAFLAKDGWQHIYLPLIALGDLPMHKAVRHHPVHKLAQCRWVHQHNLGQLPHGHPLSGFQRFKNSPCFDLDAMLL